MRKRVLGEDGLPVPGSRNPIGQFCGRLTKEAWDKIGHLKTLWEKERGFPLSITEVVEACVHQNYGSILRGLQTQQMAKAIEGDPFKEEPPLTPIEALEERVKAAHKKSPKKKGR